MNLSRRGLLGGVVGLVASPAIVRASSLMSVKAVEEDPTLWFFGDQTVDAFGLSEFVEGLNQRLVASIFYGDSHNLTSTIVMNGLINCYEWLDEE